MTYSLEFDQRALKEWHKLGDTIRQQLKKKLAEVLENPRIDANRLRELPDCYKVNLFVKGVVRRNPRNFRQPSSSPATSASRSMNLPSVWKV